MEESFLHRRQASLIPPVPNPFANEAPWTFYEVMKAGVVSFFLLPIRLTILAWCGTLEVAVARLAIVGSQAMQEERGCYFHKRHFPSWRRWLMVPLAPLNRIAMFAFGYWPGCIRVNDYRKPKAETANILVVAPHMTFVDSLILAVAFPPVPSGVGNSGILNIPVFRSLALAAQAILVDRTNKESKGCCKEILESRAGAAWNGPPVMVFPEGVITNGSALVQFKQGAFSAGQPITPVCLRYRWRHYNPSGCGKNCSMPVAILRMLLQFANFCDIDILDTYVPSEAEKKDPRLFAENVRKLMAFHLNVPFTEHSYDDAFLAYESKAHVGTDFELGPLKAMYDWSYEDLRTLLRTFEQLDGSRSGAIGHRDFAKAMQSLGLGQVRDSASVERLFSFLDQDRSGGIEYREFVQIAALLSGRCSAVTCAKLAFLIYDVGGTGKVRRGLLQKAVDSAIAHPSSEDEPSPGTLLLGEAGAEEELHFEQFVALVEAKPAVLEAGLGLLRDRLGLPGLGQGAPARKPSEEARKKLH